MPKIPHAILNKLRCTNCKCWLSCGPVRVLQDGGTVCGRCKHVAPVDQYRHFAYEAMACYFQFPCRHWENHCAEELTFKEVAEHENECSYEPGCGFCCCHPFTACRSKKKLDLDAAVLLEIIPEQILDYLRCSMCAGYLTSTPVLVGKDGTSTCHRCSMQYELIKDPEYRRHTLFESFASMMIFPCVFRYEGCTNLYKFGEPMHAHEIDCLYNPDRRAPKRPQKQKERGVIETLSGHVYGTITPNAALFALTTGKHLEKEMFSEEFQRHKETLATKWSHHQDDDEFAVPEDEPNSIISTDPRRFTESSFLQVDGFIRPSYSRIDSVSSHVDFRDSLISELKRNQSFRRSRILHSVFDGNGATPHKDNHLGHKSDDTINTLK